MKIIRFLLGKLILLLDALFSPTAPTREPSQQARVDARFASMVVYQYEACPFCVKLRRELKRQGIRMQMRDAKQEPFRTELLKGGGKVQVPCLVETQSDGRTTWLYESDAIIQFLHKEVAGS